MVASYENETAEDISASHISVLEYSSKAGMSVVSIGSDGAASEISDLWILQNLAIQKVDAGIMV